MKKLILLFFVFFPLIVWGQSNQNFNRITTTEVDSLFVTDSIKWTPFYCEKLWIVHYDYRDFDTTDATLGIYSSDWPPDSNLYELVWIDLNLDGVNDNPFTLTDSSKVIWGINGFPGQYRVDVITAHHVTDSCKLFWRQTRPKQINY